VRSLFVARRSSPTTFDIPAGSAIRGNLATLHEPFRTCKESELAPGEKEDLVNSYTRAIELRRWVGRFGKEGARGEAEYLFLRSDSERKSHRIAESLAPEW